MSNASSTKDGLLFEHDLSATAHKFYAEKPRVTYTLLFSQGERVPKQNESAPQRGAPVCPPPKNSRLRWSLVAEFCNTILNGLSHEVRERLRLEPVSFEVGHEIEFPGKLITHLYFVEHGMASLTNTFEDGSQVEVGMFGFESIIGVSALMGTIRSLNRVYTQIAGGGFRCRFKHAQLEFRRGEHFQTLALRYVQAQLVNAMQSAGCNAKHEAEQRLARWLLICCDRTNKTSFQLSQEFLADMLGTRRTTVTMAAIGLKDAGLISYSHGRLNVLDVTGLEAKACECYRVVKNYLDDLKQFASKHVA